MKLSIEKLEIEVTPEVIAEIGKQITAFEGMLEDAQGTSNEKYNNWLLQLVQAAFSLPFFQQAFTNTDVMFDKDFPGIKKTGFKRPSPYVVMPLDLLPSLKSTLKGSLQPIDVICLGWHLHLSVDRQSATDDLGQYKQSDLFTLDATWWEPTVCGPKDSENLSEILKALDVPEDLEELKPAPKHPGGLHTWVWVETKDDSEPAAS